MSKKGTLEFVLGLAAGTAAALAGTRLVCKIKKEINKNMCEQTFTSPEENNSVTLSYGSSKTARGLTYIRITAIAESTEDDCRLVLFTKKGIEILSSEWLDNDHFKILIGNGKRKQCCDVNFEEKEIVANYYLQKSVPDSE